MGVPDRRGPRAAAAVLPGTARVYARVQRVLGAEQPGFPVDALAVLVMCPRLETLDLEECRMDMRHPRWTALEQLRGCKSPVKRILPEATDMASDEQKEALLWADKEAGVELELVPRDAHSDIDEDELEEEYMVIHNGHTYGNPMENVVSVHRML